MHRFLLIPFSLVALTASPALGHGTVTSPISRVYRSYQEGPDRATSPSAVAAVSLAGSTQYYTWNQISRNVPDYHTATFANSYSAVIADGQLASGGNAGGVNPDFSGLDLVSDSWEWPATSVAAGPFDVT